MSQEIMSSDIYEISETVLELEKKFVKDATEDILMISSYGYMGAQFSKMMKNVVRMASEWGNENLILKAKFDSTILAKTVELQIKDINATPSMMSVMIGFDERELLNTMTNGQLILSRNWLIEVGKYDFHLDHDLLIECEILSTGEYVYTARYIINEYSPNFIGITNPYLSSPFRILQDNSNFIFIKCDIVQTTITPIPTNIISNNILENKTIDFDYDEQLCGFEVFIEPKGGEGFYITPIYEGMPSDKTLYCFYNYLDNNTIRIKFDPASYNPANGDTITIRVFTTTGSEANFPYKNDVISTLIDDTDKIDYNGLTCLIKTSDSTNGKDKKTMDELKAILPKEAFANGIIATDADIDTFFNNLDSDNKLVPKKKKHNQIERMYYTYFLAKDLNENTIPSNTIDIEIADEDYEIVNNRLIIQPNSRIVYDRKTKIGIIKNTESPNDEFVYSSPFITVINKDLLSVSYYSTLLNNSYTFNYKYINNDCFIQFISPRIKIERNFLIDSKFRITAIITQNSNVEQSLIELDENGNILNSKIKPILSLYSDDSAKYYVYGEIIGYDKSTYSYNIQFIIDSDNTMNENNQLLLKDMYLNEGTQKTNVYMDMNLNMELSIYLDLDKNYGGNNMVPDYFQKGYTLSNIYNTEKKVDMFFNFSSIIHSGINVYKNSDNKIIYRIKSVPLLRMSYIQDIDRIENLIAILYYRKAYIDAALDTLENGFEVDLKFYNTYGPSQIFNIGYDNLTLLDKVNLSLVFITKLKLGVDSSIIDNIKSYIKEYVENVNDIFTSIHMANLITEIKEKFGSSFDFFDFEGINKYNALYKYIVRNIDEEEIELVPEFLCIDLLDDTTPDITIKLI